jgi:hypothetical protein
MAVLRNGKQLPYDGEGSSSAYAKPLFSQQQMEQLNMMVGYALVDSSVMYRLMERDESLREEFGLEDSTWYFVAKNQFDSLEEFCQLIMSFSQESFLM